MAKWVKSNVIPLYMWVAMSRSASRKLRRYEHSSPFPNDIAIHAKKGVALLHRVIAVQLKFWASGCTSSHVVSFGFPSSTRLDGFTKAETNIGSFVKVEYCTAEDVPFTRSIHRQSFRMDAWLVDMMMFSRMPLFSSGKSVVLWCIVLVDKRFHHLIHKNLWTYAFLTSFHITFQNFGNILPRSWIELALVGVDQILLR